MTSVESCACQRGFNMSSPHPNLRCQPCPLNFFEQNNTCVACPNHSTTPQQASSRCYCKEGFYEQSFDLYQPLCAPCPENAYCTNGVISACPMNSRAPRLSSSRGDCKCDNRTHFGDLSMFSQCFLNQFGQDCELGDCKCQPNFVQYNHPTTTGKIVCLTNCSEGHVIEQYPNGSLSDCMPCPLHTYASKTFKAGESSCIPCPPNTVTLAEASADISKCTCALFSDSTNASSSCECPRGFFLSANTTSCQKCPDLLTTLTSGATSESQCEFCPKGYEVVFRGARICQKCQIGKYSGTNSKTCSPCMPGKTTLQDGATSNTDCVG